MRAALIAIVLACSASARADSIDGDDDDLAEERDARIDAPPIAAVVATAYRAAGLEHDPGRSVVRRARLAGLLPWLTVRSGSHTSWQEQAAPGIGRGTTYEVRATWRLDRLVFDGRELQVAATSAARRRERRRLASRVIRAYFAWRRATMARSPVRAEEAAAELDAITNGWFTEVRRSASETRTSCTGHAATP